MTYKADEGRRHKLPKARDRVKNWAAYDAVAASALGEAVLRLTASAQALLA